MQNIRVSLIQIPLIWESPEENRSVISNMISSSKAETDVYILPEMFTTGFTMNDEITEEFSQSSPTVSWMKSLAEKHNCAICGSVIMTDNGERANRFLWIDPDQVVYYDKRHLWAYGDEHKFFKKGMEKRIIHFKGWKILPQICYDLRFPAFVRNEWNDGKALYDLMIYVANWPDARVHAWDALGLARAIENQSYVALVNRIGRDNKDLNYVGHSALIDANGKYILEPIHNEKGVFTSELDGEKLLRFRQRFPFLMDADNIKIEE